MLYDMCCTGTPWIPSIWWTVSRSAGWKRLFTPTFFVRRLWTVEKVRLA